MKPTIVFSTPSFEEENESSYEKSGTRSRVPQLFDQRDIQQY